MRSLILLILLFFLSCGKKIEGQPNQSSGRVPQFELGAVESVRETDLLDVTVDLPIEIKGNKIIFKRGDNQLATGLFTTCSGGVDFGEVWEFIQSKDDILEIFMRGKRVKFQRVTPGQGLIGGWSWRFNQGETLILKRLTFLTMDRLIMRTHCEH